MKQFGMKVNKFFEELKAKGNEVYPYRRYTREEWEDRESRWKIDTKQDEINEDTCKVLLVAHDPYRTCWVYSRNECAGNDDFHRKFKTQEKMIEFLIEELI